MTKVCKVRNLLIGEGTPKVCVSIIERTDEGILKVAKKLALSKTDIIEWRVDYYEDIENNANTAALLKKLRKITGEIPLLFTFRTSDEGGEREISGEKYISIIKNAIESGCIDLADVELFMYNNDAKPLFEAAKEYNVKIVGSNHDFEKTPEISDILSRLEKMQEIGCDIAKIALMPQKKEDVVRLISATVMADEKLDIPIITMSMGRLGAISRIAGGTFGSTVTFASLDKASAPGQMDIDKMKSILQIMSEVGV